MISDKEYYEMLLSETREVMEGDLEEKIAYVQTAKFIAYRRAEEILNIMEDIFVRPRKPRMPCLLLYGESHNGKTSIIDEFHRRHPPTDGWDSAPLPVVVIEAPMGADTALLYDHILQNILIPFKKSHTLSQKEELIKYHFGKLGTKMLFIDEIHNILVGTATKRALFMNAIKGLSNQLQISIVMAGVSTALMITSMDEQMQSRFRPVKLPKWNLDEEYAALLASLELMLPFRKHPGISTNEKLATKIFDMSEGVLGYIVDLVEKCAISTLKKGKERISDDDLKGIDYVRPSEQREAYRG